MFALEPPGIGFDVVGVLSIIALFLAILLKKEMGKLIDLIHIELEMRFQKLSEVCRLKVKKKQLRKFLQV